MTSASIVPTKLNNRAKMFDRRILRRISGPNRQAANWTVKSDIEINNLNTINYIRTPTLSNSTVYIFT